MTLIAQYTDNFQRLMFGVISDSRALIPSILNGTGAVIKAYVDAQIALVVPGVSVYSVRTLDGNLAGYFGVQVANGGGAIIFQQFRPAFQPFMAEISQFLSTFISQGDYLFDILT